MADQIPPLAGLDSGDSLFRARVELVRERADLPGHDGARLNRPAASAEVAIALLDAEPSECFLVLLLTTRFDLIGYHIVTRGLIDAVMVHPREVFRAAILANAAAIVVAHNHPSGDPTPSPEDRAVTRQLAEAGRIMGIPVTDHIVVGCGTGTWTSLASEVI